jgi:hydrogenase maturation protein HypF
MSLRPKEMRKRVKTLIQGIVQGVGFRPFIYRLARFYHLSGYVINTSNGVRVEIEGEEEDIKDFLEAISFKKPPLALITHIETSTIPLRDQNDFSISSSEVKEEKKTLISPDICVCKDCLEEMFDKKDRRYLYPFINCTNCGPRYTIISDIPYDRINTSMKRFKMCPHCQKEYEDPSNRRFHAEPNACPICGPKISLYNAKRGLIKHKDSIKEAINLLERGYILAIKGLGGFHLAVDAKNERAVERLRKRKHREEKPLAIMSKDIEAIKTYAFLCPEDISLLTSTQRPIVIVPRKKPNPLTQSLSPDTNDFGVMLPYTPLHYLLMEGDFKALVMTSGNISEEPICIDNAEAFRRLDGIADYFLMHNRDILGRCDDSIARVINGKPRLIRRSRGYVPLPIFLETSFPSVLACGAEEKNTICLLKDDCAFLSQHIGELENLETLSFFEHVIEHLKRILEIDPKIIAYDLHPQYLSTKWAKEKEGIKLIGIQHHHAHILSCLAENRDIFSPVIGLALDGTGYGSDGHLWGGEVLLVKSKAFKRLAHLFYYPLPGGYKAIKEPWRMAISYLYYIFGKDVFSLPLKINELIAKDKLQLVFQMIEKHVNCPLTSSLGRLFDAISAILGFKLSIAYSAQAAIFLEHIREETKEGYLFDLNINTNPWQIEPRPVIEEIIGDLKDNVPIDVISGRFHKGLVNVLKEVSLLAREKTGINKVALSGGVFQNSYILAELEMALIENGFIVYSHSQVPANDAGISLGQAVMAGLSSA